jgi:pSer/pThr/pTyr-binding forkhead associated (FHA) protein
MTFDAWRGNSLMSSDVPHKKNETRAVLYPLDAKGRVDPVKLRRDATIIGREKGDVLIMDQEISSTHCQIQNINGSYHIFDMNSTNGTFVNKAKVLKSKLNNGDEITIGKTTFRFSLEDDAKVRHINTIFTNQQNPDGSPKGSLVDTLIEDEVRRKRSYSIILNIRYGDGHKEQIELPQKQVFLGRATSFGRFESDVEISRKHVLVKINDHGEIFAEDQGSTNGTFLNGTKIKGMHPVKPQDVLRLGAIEVRITVKTG